MNELIESFLEAAKDKGDKLSISKMLSEDEVFEWEVLVKAMDSIDILHVGRDLDKVKKTYQLERWQEMSIIAYVKVLEMMIKRAKDYSEGISDELPLPEPDTPTNDLYSGSMFG